MAQEKIFCIGLPRTGTTSLCKFLNMIGLKTKHFPFEIFQNTNYALLILNMIGLKTKHLPFELDLNLNSPLMNKYVGFGDSPIPLIYKDLDRKFPNSKFILTTRSLDSWLDSMQWLLEHGKVKWNWSTKVHIYHHIFLGTKTFKKRILEHKFADFHTDVLKYFESRPKDLLILDMEKGFDTQEICDFLQVPATQVEYPHSNKRTTTTFYERVSYEFRQRKTLLDSLTKKLGKNLK